MSDAPPRANRPLLILMVVMMAIVAVAVVTMWKIVAAGPRVDPFAPQSQSQAESAAPPAPSGMSIGGPFTLVDQTGATVTDQSFAGRYRLIYFGYTFCPDACPTALQVMSQAIESLGPDAARIQPIFITIDPVRDTAQQLANYVPLFDKRLVGLTGTPAQIANVARAYKVYYAKADDRPDYAMNHSSFVYLMGPDGRFLTVFGSDIDADKMAAGIKTYLKPS